MSIRRLDLEGPFLDMSGAIHDLAALSAISVTLMESTIRSVPDSVKSHYLPNLIQEGYVAIVLTEEQYRSVHFIGEHIRGIAQTARLSLEAVEELIMERSR